MDKSYDKSHEILLKLILKESVEGDNHKGRSRVYSTDNKRQRIQLIYRNEKESEQNGRWP
jgi:hypothetical protein